MSVSTVTNDVESKSPVRNDTSLRSTLPDLLDTSQAAAILNVTPRTVTRMCEQGKLKAVRVMSLWRINRDRLLDFAGLN